MAQQKIQANIQKEQERPRRLEDDNLMITDPLNTVTTLNFKEIRNEIDKSSPENAGGKQPEAAKADDKRSKNAQQALTNQAATAGSKSTGHSGTQQRQKP